MADAVQRGFYHQALQPWWDRFGDERVLVLQYERCVADLHGQLSTTFAFLGLTEYHVSDVELPGQPVEGTARTPAGSDEVRRLIELYIGDVERLAARLPGLDLSLWPNFAYLAGSPAAEGDASVGAGNSPTRRR
jgi:hypothetical protein